MNTALKIGLGLLVAFILFIIITLVSVMSMNNEAVNHEEGIKAQYKQNQNNYDNYFKKLKEVAQVPEMYSADLKNIYDGVIKGRYGADGSKAVFQFIKEQNPNLDSSLYKQIQQVIESGRNSFAADQKTLLDKKRIYEVSLRTFPNSFIFKVLGFPKINLAEFDIITSEETDKAFKTKKSEPIKLK